MWTGSVLPYTGQQKASQKHFMYRAAKGHTVVQHSNSIATKQIEWHVCNIELLVNKE